MNENLNQTPNEQIPEITPEERKSHKRNLSKLCLAYLAYIVIIELIIVAVSYAFASMDPNPLADPNVSIVISSAIQYLIAFPILALLLKTVPARAPEKKSLGAKSFFKYAFVSMFIMYVGNYISTMLMSYIEMFLGRAPENSVDVLLDNTNILLSVLIVGIIGPIVEELMFRKLFIDRLTQYGDAVAIFLPALMFGLFHGNLYQFFYAFFLGVAFSYIYVKTGKIIYSTLLHIFINLFCGVFPAYILSLFDLEEFLELALEGTIPEEYIMANLFPLLLLAAYEFIMFAMIGVGIYTLVKNLREIRLEKGEVRFPKGTGADVFFFNPGTVLLITVCLVIMAINTFAV